MSIDISPTPSPPTTPPTTPPTSPPNTTLGFSRITLPPTFTPLSSPPPEFEPDCTPYELGLRDAYFRIQKSWSDTQATLRQLLSLLHDVGPGSGCSLPHFLGIRGSVPLWEFEEEAELGNEILADIAAVEREVPELRKARDRILTHLNVLKAGEEWDEYCRALEGMEEEGWEGDRWRFVGLGGLEVVMGEPEETDAEEDEKTKEGGAGDKSESRASEKCLGGEYVLDLQATMWPVAHQLKEDSVATWDREAVFYADPEQERQQEEEEEKEEKEDKQGNTWEEFLKAEATPLEIPEKSPWEMHEELREILAFEVEYELMRDCGFEWEY